MNWRHAQFHISIEINVVNDQHLQAERGKKIKEFVGLEFAKFGFRIASVFLSDENLKLKLSSGFRNPDHILVGDPKGWKNRENLFTF